MSDGNFDLNRYIKAIRESDTFRCVGRITQLIGLIIEAQGPKVTIGELCYIQPQAAHAQSIPAEVVGFRNGRVLLMPLAEMSGIGPGCEVVAAHQRLSAPAGFQLLGRVVDGLGKPIDKEKAPIVDAWYPLENTPPAPLERHRIEKILPVGIKAIDGLLTCGRGQRVGIMAGSGVGKSTLLGMIARNTEADINVIALIGERGREVRDFIERDLGEAGLKRSVVVAATSDQPALVRIKGAFTATAIAEYFRDQGKDVMLMMDSVTRFAMAQREVGLSIGEPPATRGYPPSVFALLPRLLERSGTGEKGSITAIYTVLVEGDDMNEPIADAVRGILDGHIVLSRKLAAKGHYPSIDIPASVSRIMPDVTSKEHRQAAQNLRALLATYNDAEDLVNLGAYVKGSNPKIDQALSAVDDIQHFLCQGVEENCMAQESIDYLIKRFS